MIDVQTMIDNVKSEMDSVCDYVRNAETAFKRIADLARDADEYNWKNAIEEIFDIAYDHY